MKKTTLFFTTCLMAILLMGGGFLQAQTVYPYFPDSNTLTDLSGTATTVSDPSNHAIAFSGNFTFEVAGTELTPITLSNGSVYYEYTPTASGMVRFVKKGDVVYVYEGFSYKGIISSQLVPTNYPEITDVDVTTNENQLLQNASFETIGSLVGDSNYNFGSPWITNVTVPASLGIRIGTNANTVNGSYACIWRGSGNSNYFAQPLTGINANTNYQVKIRQVDSGNAYADFNIGFGSTAGGLDYGSTTVRLGKDNNGTKIAVISTSDALSGTVYFTFKNTSNNTASSGSDPVTQMDYISLVEGVSSIPTGISGTSGTALYVEGTAYAPEITLGEGDYWDMTSFIANPSFEEHQGDKQQTIPGWTKVGPADSEYCTRSDKGPLEGEFKTGNVYFQYWSSSKPDFSISQTLTDLPNGKYIVTAAAGGSETTKGTYVFAGDNQTEVTNTGDDYSVEAVVTNGTLNLGFKSVSRNVSWAYADNFRLYYRQLSDPLLSVSETNKTLNYNMQQFTFEVTGFNLTDDVTISAPEAITLSQTSLTQVEAEEGVEITATWNGSTDLSNSNITISSTDAESKSISVNAYAPKISNWDGRGVTGPSSKPTDIGWFNSDSAYDWWDVANGGGGVRLRDNVAPISDGRYLMLRGDYGANNTTFFYPVYFDGGYNYTFSMDFFNGNGTNGQNILVRLFEVADTESTPIVTKQFTVGDKNVIMSDNLKFTIEEESSGVYYFAFTCPDSWQGITNLELTSFTTENTPLNFDNTVINTEYFTLQGVKVDRPIENGVYLMKRSYISGKTEVIKAFYKAQ